MIQFNLLPDVKLDYIKSKKNKHLIITSSVIVSGAALAVLIILFMKV